VFKIQSSINTPLVERTTSYDPTGKTVLLLLKNQAQDIFKPGDRIELTVSNTITNADQESVDRQHRVLKGIAN
jgi:hypothetical protein